MAPISDKRQRQEHNSPLKESVVGSHVYGQLHVNNSTTSNQNSNLNYQQQPQHKQFQTRNYAHTKENTGNGSNNNTNNNNNLAVKSKHIKSNLDIRDFRETWLEAMEKYKDQLKGHKHHLFYPSLTAATNANNTTSASAADIDATALSHTNIKSDTLPFYTQVQPNQQQLQQLQQFFKRTPQMCQHESHNLKQYSNTNRSLGLIDPYQEHKNHTATITTVTTTATSRSSPRRQNNNSNSNHSPTAKRRHAKPQSPKFTRHALRIAATNQNLIPTIPVIGMPTPVADLHKTAEKQLLLKRPREDTNLASNKYAGTATATITSLTANSPSSSPANFGNNQQTKRHTRDHHYTPPAANAATATTNHHSVHVSAVGGGGSGNSGAAGALGQAINSNNSSLINSNNNINVNSNRSAMAKVIVNQFHASRLLNSCHYDEKTKILTQNGLNKSAANAYEASFYATNYLTAGDPRNLNYNGVARPYCEYNNYAGVAMNSDHARSRGGNCPPPYEDDPCAAIDNVDDFESESEDEEYVGQPLFLKDDGEDSCQSRNIRHGPDFDNKSILNKKKDGDSLAPSDVADIEGSFTSEQTVYYTPRCILSPSLFPNVPPYLNFCSHAEKGPDMPAPLHKVLKWKLSPVMPRIVKRVVLNSGFRIIKNTTDWMAVWEKHMKSPGFRTIRSHQKYNHMPGSFRIGRKDSMWRCIHNNIKKFGNKEFGFMQKSYIMPDDLEALRQSWPKNVTKLTKWIVKPPASARGTGIRIVSKWSQFPKDRPLVVQKYIERPLLINDNKFDMRIYVVVTSINPLRIYMYKDGLARFASVKYSSELNSLDDRCMHLTNYSINKLSQNYAKNEDINACQGHKWSLQSLWSCLEKRGINTKRLWATLRNLIVRAIVSGESGLNRMYRQNVNFRYNCFELFGFDVLLDENLIPWLLEINISPSLHSELPLDLHIKGPLIQATLNTALYQVPPKLTEKQQEDICQELNLKGPLCLDKRLFTTCLTAEEVRKHNFFTNRAIEFREEYLEAILEHLLPDDVRCLIIAEDELARCSPMERIFPTADTYIYLKYIENSRYYNRLLDAWEHRYAHCREAGIAVLSRLCETKYHLQVSDADKEPDITITDIDMLHARKSEIDPNLFDNKADDKPKETKVSTIPTVHTVVSAVQSEALTCAKEAVINKDVIKSSPTAVKVN